MARVTRIYRLTTDQFDLLDRMRRQTGGTMSGLMDSIVEFIDADRLRPPADPPDRGAVQLKFQPEVLDRLQRRAAEMGMPLIRMVLLAAEQIENAGS